MNYLYNPPTLIKKVFSDFYWNSAAKKVLLTFDDGPNAVTTELILKTLSDSKIKALFFCVGNNVKIHRTLAKLILYEGHTIGNHTYHHKIITKLKTEEVKEEITLFNQQLFDTLGYNVKYFRPPHGKINLKSKKIIKETGLHCVMWNLLTYDFENNFKKVKNAVNKNIYANSIIVLHDSNKSKNIIVDSINYIVEKVHENGFEFGEPDECLN